MKEIEPGLNASGQLTPEARKAVDAYLMRYGRMIAAAFGFLGITTVLSVAVSLGYVFFQLPDAAAEKAFAAWESKFSRYEEKIEGSLAQANKLEANVEAAERQLAELNRTMPDMKKQVSILQEESSRLTEMIGNVSESDLARAAEIATTLSAQTVAQAINDGNAARAEAREALRLVADLRRRLDETERLLQDQVLRANAQPMDNTTGTPTEVDATGAPVRQQ